jgi:hypothetical protein
MNKVADSQRFLLVYDGGPGTQECEIVEGHERVAAAREKAERYTDGGVGVLAFPLEDVLDKIGARPQAPRPSLHHPVIAWQGSAGRWGEYRVVLYDDDDGDGVRCAVEVQGRDAMGAERWNPTAAPDTEALVTALALSLIEATGYAAMRDDERGEP